MTQTRRICVRSTPAHVLSKRHSARPMEIVAVWWKTGGGTHGRSPRTRNKRCHLIIASLSTRTHNSLTPEIVNQTQPFGSTRGLDSQLLSKFGGEAYRRTMSRSAGSPENPIDKCFRKIDRGHVDFPSSSSTSK